MIKRLPAAAFTVLAFASGCSVRHATQQQQAGTRAGFLAPVNATYLPLHHITAITRMAGDACDRTIKNIGPVGNVVRLHLTSALLNHLIDGTAGSYISLDVTAPSLTLKQYGSEYVDDDTATVTGTINQATDPMQSVTRLDIDLSQNGGWLWQPIGINKYKPILLKIILDDPGLTFINPNGGDDSSEAVQTDELTASTYPKMFDCLQPIVTQMVHGVVQQSIQFRVKHTGGKAVGSLNIGVTGSECGGATGCFVVPIVLDPKVPNSG